jgi:hypothetical protein
MISEREVIKMYDDSSDVLSENLKLFEKFFSNNYFPFIYSPPSVSKKNKDGILVTTSISILNTLENDFNEEDDYFTPEGRYFYISSTGVTDAYRIGYDAFLYITTVVNGTEHSAELKNIYEILKDLCIPLRRREKELHDSSALNNFHSSNIDIYNKILSIKNYDLKKLEVVDSDEVILNRINALKFDIKFSDKVSVDPVLHNAFDKIMKDRNAHFINFIKNKKSSKTETYKQGNNPCDVLMEALNTDAIEDVEALIEMALRDINSEDNISYEVRNDEEINLLISIYLSLLAKRY